MRRTEIVTGAIEFQAYGKSYLGKEYYDDLDFLWASFIRGLQYTILKKPHRVDWASSPTIVNLTPDARTDSVIFGLDGKRLFGCDRLTFVISVGTEAAAAMRAISSIFPKVCSRVAGDIQIADQLVRVAKDELDGMGRHSE